MIAKWKPEWDALLGTMSDVELAARCGVSVITVGKHRHGHGIRKFDSVTSRCRALTDAEVMPLVGHATARRLGIAVSAIGRERRRRRLLARGGGQQAVDMIKRAAIAGIVAAFGPEVTLAQIGKVLRLTRERVR